MRKLKLLFILLLLPAISFSQTPTCFYKDKVFNKQVVFKENPDELIIHYRASKAESHSEYLASYMTDNSATKIHLSDDLQVAVYKLPDAGRKEAILDGLRSRSILRNSTPSLKDTEGNTMYYMPGRFTVQFEEAVSEKEMKSIIEKSGCEIMRDHWTKGYYTLETPGGESPFKLIREFIKLKQVKFAEPDFIDFNSETYKPNDSFFADQWGLENTKQSGGYEFADIGAVEAWDITLGSSDVMVCVIDDGFDLDHDDLWTNYYQNLGEDADGDNQTLTSGGFLDANDINGIDDDGNGIVDDLVGYDFASLDYDVNGGRHGTACTGIAAAVGNNTIGISGIAPNSTILPLRVNLTSGMNANRADAINYAASLAEDNPQMVISCSWKASGDMTAIHLAIQNARLAGVPLFFASANDNASTVSYPSRYAEAISVGATSMCDERKNPSSCDGEYWWGSNYGSDLSIAAPGVRIFTTDVEESGGYTSGDYVENFNGTSSATPLAAGVGALIFSFNNNLTPWEIQDRMQMSADKVGGYNYSHDADRPGHSLELGYGRINACRALVSGTFRDEWGSNNSYSRACGPVLDQMNMSGSLGSTGSYDWYYFDVEQPGTITICLFGAYKSWSLYKNPSGSALASESVGKEKIGVTSYNITSTGRYYLRFSGYAGTYDFSLSGANILSDAFYEKENNNSYSNANGLLNSGQVVSAVINSSSDVDWYWFEVEQAGTITITSTKAYKSWELYKDPTQSPLKSSNGSSSYYASTTGRYYLKFGGYADPYEFKVTGNLADGLYESEYNGEFIAADGPLHSGLYAGGKVNVSGDEDWYYCDVDQTGSLSFTLNGYYKGIAVYNNPYQSPVYNLSVGSQGSATGSYAVTQTGRYYFKIGGYTGSYTFSAGGSIMKKSMEPFERKSVFDRGQMLTEKEQRIKVYPNPVNSKANIQFELDEDCHVSLKVYNVMGEAVSVLADEDLTAGYHNFIWDRKGLTGHRVSEGMYFVRFETQGTVETKRILVIE
ncbi:MAG: S8 family serine peptidase [Bacteroidales bacterium]|jgi:hypothetical protein